MSGISSPSNCVENPETTKSQGAVLPVIAVGFTLLAGWLFVLNPAQRQIASLQQRCDELAVVVEKLAGESEAIQRSNTVLELVNSQAAAIDSAEASLTRLDRFHQELGQRLDTIQRRNTTLDCLTEIEQSAVLERQSLTSVLKSLNALEETHQLVTAGTSIVPDVQHSLNVLDDLHIELEAQREDAQAASDALSTLNEVCSALVASQSQVEGASGVVERWAITQNKLLKQADQLDTAEQSLGRMAEVNSILNGQSPILLKSRRNLDRLVQLSQELGQQDDLIVAAGMALENIRSMAPAVNQAANTIDAIQRLVVDVCLTHPADAYEVAKSTLGLRRQSAVEPTLPIASEEQESTDEASEEWGAAYQAFRIVPTLLNLR